jgi:3-hydroxybutyryl-CoA dehydrogenase
MSLAVAKPGSAVAIIGSGKMARNIGMWFVRAGHRVTFFPSTEPLCDECRLHVQKKFRRLQDLCGGALPMPRVCLAGACSSAAFDFVVEATTESLDIKQRRFSDLRPFITPATVLCSASSSILPSCICPDCCGMHFFYPVEMSGFVELIAENTTPEDRIEHLKSFAASCGLDYVLENEESAFCANRLLLPLQAEALRMVQSGLAASDIDACTVSDLLPLGQLGLMDAVGLDVVHAGVINYVMMMPPDEREDFIALAEALKSAINHGKLGNKNRNGLLCGMPLREATHSLDPAERAFHTRTFLFLFVNTCCSFLERRFIDEASIDTIVSKAFQASATLADIINRIGGAAIAGHCNSRFLSTGISYFKPSASITR